MALKEKCPYIVTWRATGDALDVSGNDNRSSILFQKHKAVNQQWILEQVGTNSNRYKIRGSSGYISFLGRAEHNTPIECSENQQVWRIVPDSTNANAKFIMHETLNLVLDVKRQQDGSQRVHLLNYNKDTPQIWEFEEHFLN